MLQAGKFLPDLLHACLLSSLISYVDLFLRRKYMHTCFIALCFSFMLYYIMTGKYITRKLLDIWSIGLQFVSMPSGSWYEALSVVLFIALCFLRLYTSFSMGEAKGNFVSVQRLRLFFGDQVF